MGIDNREMDNEQENDMGHIPEHNCPVTTEPALCYQKRCEKDPCDGAKEQRLRDVVRFQPDRNLGDIAWRCGFTLKQAREILSEGE